MGTDPQAGTTDLAVPPSSSMTAIVATPELVNAAYNAIMLGELPPEVGDPAVSARLILERIRRGTLEESLEPTQSLPSWKGELLGVEVTVLGFHFNPSTFKADDGDDGDEGSKSSVYAVVELVDADGVTGTYQCGGSNVLMQLVKAWEEGKYPFVCTLEGSKTGRGYTTLWLRRPGESES